MLDPPIGSLYALDLCLRKIQFDADAVGIVEEYLGVARARHDALAEFDVP
jgi:hypothetical protein